MLRPIKMKMYSVIKKNYRYVIALYLCIYVMPPLVVEGISNHSQCHVKLTDIKTCILPIT